MTPTGPAGSSPDASASPTDLQQIVEEFDRDAKESVCWPALLYRSVV